MRKFLLFGFLLVTLILLPRNVFAASANIRVSSSASTAIVGSTISVNVTVSSSSALGSWEFLLTYNSSYLQLISSNTESGGDKAVGYVSNQNTKSKTYNFKFKALKSGTVQIGIGSYLVYGIDEALMSVSVSNTSIRIMTQDELQATYSKDNNLKSLGVEGYEITPAFSASVTEYSLSVPSTVDKINIVATQNESHASINGDGEKEVMEGTNSFEIKVTAQNGDEKTYKLIVNVEDKNPIEVMIDGILYTVVKNVKNVTKPELYEETTISLNEMEVPAYINETTGYVLVALKDMEGSVIFALYDKENNSYELYHEQNSQILVINILEPIVDLEGFIKTTIDFDGLKYQAFQVEDNSNFAVVYGMNVETGEKGFYLYDKVDHTFQRYFDEMTSLLKEENQQYKYVIMGFAGLCVFLVIVCMFAFLRKPNKKLLKKLALLEEQKRKSSSSEQHELVENSVSVEEQSKSEKASKKKKKRKAKKNKTDVSDSSEFGENSSLESEKKENPISDEKTEKLSDSSKLDQDDRILDSLDVKNAIDKMSDAEEMIREYEKTMALSKAELEQTKKESETLKSDSENTDSEPEETMYDLFGEDKKKRKK